MGHGQQDGEDGHAPGVVPRPAGWTASRPDGHAAEAGFPANSDVMTVPPAASLAMGILMCFPLRGDPPRCELGY